MQVLCHWKDSFFVWPQNIRNLIESTDRPTILPHEGRYRKWHASEYQFFPFIYKFKRLDKILFSFVGQMLFSIDKRERKFKIEKRDHTELRILWFRIMLYGFGCNWFKRYFLNDFYSTRSKTFLEKRSARKDEAAITLFAYINLGLHCSLLDECWQFAKSAYLIWKILFATLFWSPKSIEILFSLNRICKILENVYFFPEMNKASV